MRFVLGIFVVCVASTVSAEWHPHRIQQLNGRGPLVEYPAEFQIISEHWSEIASIPSMAYVPEKDRVVMSVNSGQPQNCVVLWSDDHGDTWSEPQPVRTDQVGAPELTGLSAGITYLQNGQMLLVSSVEPKIWLWFSADYGQTWGEYAPFPAGPQGIPFNFGWDPPLVDRDSTTGKVQRLMAGGFAFNYQLHPTDPHPDMSVAGVRFSSDLGRTWGDVEYVPQWQRISEITFVRAQNGNIVAAGRTDMPHRFLKTRFDQYEGFGTSVSEDNGKTWSDVKTIFSWGRMHSSMVLMPDGQIVMTYVVRKGYPRTANGLSQFGIEAIVSRDHGQTWDLDHRCILARWTGTLPGPNAFQEGCQATSTVLLNNGFLLTSFGTGFRSGNGRMRDVALVRWKLDPATASAQGRDESRRIAEAPDDSALRNEFDPDALEGLETGGIADSHRKRNVAVPELGVEVSASANDGDVRNLLFNAYNWPIVTFQSIPAWIEMRWPKSHRIDEMRIYPSAPRFAGRAVTEGVPRDYRLQYLEGDTWKDLVEPTVSAPRMRDFYGNSEDYLVQEKEFVYVHQFAPVTTNAIRMEITRSSDAGLRQGTGDTVVVPEQQRETCLRRMEVFAEQE